MFPLKQAVRTAFRAAPRSNALPRTRAAFQQRWATYQYFPGPGKGGKQGGSGPKYSNFGPFARAQYVWYNYQKPIIVVGAASGGIYVFNLEQVPITGRRRFNIVGPELEKKIAQGGGYDEILQQYQGRILPENHPVTQKVAKVVSRLLPATGGLAGDDWKVHVIDDPEQMNAFVMPGGKVFVFTGILPICQDENGLAAVLGHEIAHNMAHHVAERLSRQVPILLATVAGSLLFDVSGQMSSQIVQLLLSLPNSRTQEQEADHIGLLMMAQSCYDPNRVPDLWRRMAEVEKNAPPQFLSTHPASAARAEVIKGWLPEAMEKYNESDCATTSRNAEEFRKIFVKMPVAREIPRSIFDQSGGGSRRGSDDDDFF